jgi:hypothetical protein
MLKQSITSSGGKEEKERLRQQKRTTQRKLCPYQPSCPQAAGDAILARTAVAREVAPSAVLTAWSLGHTQLTLLLLRFFLHLLMLMLTTEQ